jgi:restriction endonuclease S subunit
MVQFVAAFLASIIPQQILSVVGSGRTVQAGLKMSDIKNLLIPIPSRDEVKRL